MIFGTKITVFNFDQDSGSFLKTLISDVECQYYFGIHRLYSHNDAVDRCIAIIKFSIENGSKITKNGQVFLSPEEWKDKTAKTGFFTFQTDKDFFSLGDFTDKTVTNYDSIKTLYPNHIFLINQWYEYESVLPHWEVFGH